MPLYATQAASATTSDLYTLDSDTAVATSIGPTGHAFTGLAFDPTDGTLYGITSPQDGNPATRKALFTIDPATGASTLVGLLQGPAGATAPLADITFDSSGQLYGWSGQTGDIHLVNKADGTYTVLGVGLGLSPSSAALAFDSDDVLWLLARVSGITNLYTVDPETSDPTLVGPIVPSSSDYPAALTFDADGLLWWMNGGGGGSGVRLRTLNTITQEWTVVGTSSTDPGNNFDGLTWTVSGAPSFPTFKRIKFGDGLDVTDEGGGVIRVDVGIVGGTAGGDGGNGGSGTGPDITGLEYPRFVTFLASTIMTDSFGRQCFSFDETPVNSYDPNVEIAIRDPIDSQVIKMLSVGTYHLEAICFLGVGGAHPGAVQFNGTGFTGFDLHVLPNIPDFDSFSGFVSGTANWIIHPTSIPYSFDLWVHSESPIISGSTDCRCVLTITKYTPT